MSKGLRALFHELAESVLRLDHEELAVEASVLECESVRSTLLAHVNTHRRGALAVAYANYQREVTRMRTQNYQLPPSPEGRRQLLAHLFQTYPQMERTFLTVQHREFAALSDGDVESCLKQLQELGAYAPKSEPWNEPLEQQPETD